jgi:hypothetical protein
MLNKIQQHESSTAAKEFVDNLPLYSFANPENLNGDTIATHVVKRLLQYAYDRGALKGNHICVDNNTEWCGCED